MNKEEFQKNAKSKIDELFAEIDKLEAKKDGAKGAVKDNIDKQISALKAKRDQLEQKYNSLKKATEEQWEGAKKAFSDAADSFNKGISKITSLFD